MLRQLSVRNYVLIDSLDIQFPEGLVIITGQTGAGKSIILGALSLLLGAKADASVLGEAGDNCVVEADFEIDPDDAVARALIEENDMEWNDGHLTLRRVVARTGRSRAFLNDEPVNLPFLTSLSRRLIDIHSQHQTMMLSDHQFQMTILDLFASNSDLLSKCSQSWTALQALKSELQELDSRIASIDRDREYNEAQWKQLDAAALKEDELESLEAEQKTLANAEEIKTLIADSINLTELHEEGGDFSLVSNLREMERNMQRLSRFMPAAEGLASRIESCRLEMEDISSELTTLDMSVDASPDRLQIVEERIALIYALMKKHAVTSVAELIAIRDALSENLADSSVFQEKRKALLSEIAQASDKHTEICAQLHDSRQKASESFAKAIEESLRFLELPLAVFDVQISEAEQGPKGYDHISFRFSSTGRNLQDLSRCASGGEMSRIMLCLKDMMAKFSSMPAMIFDEIDTGVSGSVADKMGSMICSMGNYMQVFAITHLPQVAAKGNAHYLVAKSLTPDGRTISRIEKLSQEQRVLEIARMLSGSELTDAAIANARSLLN